MLVSEFINKAAEQQQYISHVDVTVLTPLQRQLHLDAKCICCEGHVDVHGIEDIEYYKNYVKYNIVGWTADLLCPLCMDHLPAELLRKYGVISQSEYDTLVNPFDDYTPMDSNDLKDLTDPVKDYGIVIKHHNVDNSDDDLPF